MSEPISSFPNILIIVADQLTAAALPAYGNRVARTPNIDRLAAEGVCFASAYSNSPLCGPARYTLATGQLPTKTGAYDNACDLRSDTPTFAHYVRRAGYRTITAGKMHFVGPDQLHGFEERITTDIYPADFGWTPDWTQPEIRPEWYHSMDSVLSAGPCVRSNQIDFDEEVIFTARRKLFDLARFGDGRPFCLMASLTHPHDPFTIQQQYWDRYTDAEIDMPRIAPLAHPDPHTARLRHVSGMDLNPVNDAQIRAARHAYYGAISFVDDQVGALCAVLEETGLADKTIILFTSDHGEMLGERGLWYKMSFFEGAAHIPLIIHSPQHFTPKVVQQTVSLVDVLPTLCAISGAEVATEVDGHSLLPHARGEEGTHDEAIGEYCGEGAIDPIVMIRRGKWKFVHSPVDPDQLYDLQADPDELNNLAASGQAADVVEQFKREVAARWNLGRVRADVLASQQRRRLVAEALKCGKRTAWDYQPPGTAETSYIRSFKPLDSIELDARLPVRPSVQTKP